MGLCRDAIVEMDGDDDDRDDGDSDEVVVARSPAEVDCVNCVTADDVTDSFRFTIMLDDYIGEIDGFWCLRKRRF